MKQIKLQYATLSFIILISTNQVFASGAKLPVIAKTQTPSEQESTIPAIKTPTTKNNGAYVEAISDLAKESSCSKYSWKDRGRAPSGYIKGVTLSFARSLCRLKSQSALSTLLSRADTRNDAKDALTHYQAVFSNFSIPTMNSGEEPLRALYTLGMGLGMRESSGKYCEGWDRSAGSSRSSSAGEAGVFQTSYDSMGSSPELPKLYAEYQAKPESCLLDIFKEGASCSSLSNLGSGSGEAYQAFNKSCPAFATEYAMVMLRVQRGHYGPINRREAEVVPACNQLLKDVAAFISSDPYACEDLN